MANLPKDDEIDWSLTTFEGARQEQLRRWNALTLAEKIEALEDMQELADKLRQATQGR